MVFTPHQKQTVASRISLGQKLFSLGLLAVLAGAVIVYIMLTNSLATQGYVISDLQKKAAETSLTAQRLEMQAADLQSIRKLEQGVLPEGYVAVERVEYLAAIPQVGVAVK